MTGSFSDPDALPAPSCDLIQLSNDLMRLLHAVDCYPNVSFSSIAMLSMKLTARNILTHDPSLSFLYVQGGLYEGAFAIEAARRYEEVWLPILQKTPETVNLIPPVDIAFAALVHRLNPSAFQADMAKLGIKQLDSKGKPWPSPNPFDFTDGIVQVRMTHDNGS